MSRAEQGGLSPRTIGPRGFQESVVAPFSSGKKEEETTNESGSFQHIHAFLKSVSAAISKVVPESSSAVWLDGCTPGVDGCPLFVDLHTNTDGCTEGSRLVGSHSSQQQLGEGEECSTERRDDRHLLSGSLPRRVSSRSRERGHRERHRPASHSLPGVGTAIRGKRLPFAPPPCSSTSISPNPTPPSPSPSSTRKPTRFPEDLNLRRWKRLSPAKRRASRQTPLVTIPENREVTLWTDAASLSASLSSSSCSSSSSSSSGTAGVRRGASFPPSSLASLQRRLGGRSRRSVSLSRSLSETELEVDQTRRGGTGSSESGGSSFSSLSFLKEAVKTLEPLDDDDLSDSMASDCSSSSSISSCSSSSEGTGGRHRHRHNSFTQALFPSLSSSVSESSGSHGSRLNRQGPAPLSLSALSLPHPLTAETLKEGMWRRQMETERETETETATEEGHMGGEREGDGGPGGRQQQTVGDGSASASLWLDRVLRFVSGLSASTASGSGSEGGGGSGSPSSSPEARGVEVEREGIVSRWAEEKPEEPVVASGSAVGGAEGKTRSFGANADTSSSSTALPVDPSVSPPFSLLPSSARPPRALTASVDAEEEEDASLTVSASSSLSASTQATETEGERQVHAEREAASSREGERSCRLSSGSAADLKVNEGMLAADSVHEAVELWAGKEGGQGGGADRPSQFSLSLLPGLRGRPANASLAFVLVVFLGVLWDLFVAFRGKGKRGRRKRERGGGRERLISFILGGGTAGGGATRPGGSAGVRLFWRLLSSAVSSRLSRRKQTVKAIL